LVNYYNIIVIVCYNNLNIIYKLKLSVEPAICFWLLVVDLEDMIVLDTIAVKQLQSLNLIRGKTTKVKTDSHHVTLESMVVGICIAHHIGDSVESG